EEEEILVSNLDLKFCEYFALHPSNIVRADLLLPKEKDLLLHKIRQTRAGMTKETLMSRPSRVGEGGTLL
ncbi:MAG: hypothetical protein IIV18_08210, partial [Lachnospiraceae bacterium]|nr:hypothetical protein [Lachnospiraceae bacterium]